MRLPLYLDANATTPLLPEVREAVAEAEERYWANPGSMHGPGQEAAMAVDRARSRVGRLVGRPTPEVFFTSGATEANAWALRGFLEGPRDRVITSAVEHASVRAWATDLVEVDGQGVIRLDHLDALLAEHAGRVAIVSVMAANNETGVLQPVAEVSARCRAAGVPLHSDAAQVPGRIAFDVPADLVTLSAHKFGGPKGVGVLAGRPPPRSLLRGGPQERGLRAGTPNVAGIVGLGVAAALAGTIDPTGRDRLEVACRAFGGRVLGERAARLPNTLCVMFDQPGDLVVIGLDLEGVCASTGSTCSSGAAEESAVVRAMGLRGIPVRFSLSGGVDVDRAIEALGRVLARIGESA